MTTRTEKPSPGSSRQMIYGGIDRDTVSYGPKIEAPIVTLVAEELENNASTQTAKLKLTIYEGETGEGTILFSKTYMANTYSVWDHIYRFASLMYNQTDNPCDDGSRMENVQFSNLALFDSTKKKYVDWWIHGELCEYAWLVKYPCASFTDGSIEPGKEIFNINNNWGL